MKEKIDIENKLSIKGIFLVYNFSLIRKSLPIWIAIAVVCMYVLISLKLGNNQKDFAKFLIIKIDSLFPNLIGFSLGGYAIIVAFGNTNFLKRIAKSGEPYYEELNAIFAFSIILQVLVLFISFTSQVVYQIFKNILTDNCFTLSQYSYLTFNTLSLFFIIWALSLIPYVVSNIFIFGETHHELLRNESDESNL